MVGEKRSFRSIVFLIGYDVDEKQVEETSISYEDYYDGSSPMIDEDDYRASRGIRSVVGKIYDSAGRVQQEFYNQYDECGEYVKSRILLDDGTVVED